MLVRFIVKNLYSFGEETEFNAFPSKTKRLSHHKLQVGHAEIVRINAVYGANASGKSNLIIAAYLLQKMIKEGEIIHSLSDNKFKLNAENQKQPITFGIEFYTNEKMYFYTLTLDENIILEEALYESQPKNDVLVFERSFENEKQSIVFPESYLENPENKLFTKVLAEKMLKKNQLLITFFNSNYTEDFLDIATAFNWFDEQLVIIFPDAKPTIPIVQMLDIDETFKTFSIELFKNVGIGASILEVQKEVANPLMGDDNWQKAIHETKQEKNPNLLKHLEYSNGEEVILTYENGNVIAKRLIIKYLNNKGKQVDFPLSTQSDGTKRIIDYLVAFYTIANKKITFLFDEIERSIHPKLIKEIISKISLDEDVKGQIIFTTHESCLLDQDILRPDEIWFVEKDITGNSKLYPLSDFKVHHTANIENGYLNGRYGAIPFLSDLKTLNWHKYEVSE